jgi:hypothetical protein
MPEPTLSASSTDVGPSHSRERHALVRLPCSQEVYCQPTAAPTAEESETRWLGRFRDVSPEGLTLVLRRRFEPGTSLIIELSDKRKRRARPFPVQVVQAVAEGKGRWIISCEFLRPLGEEEWQALGEE